jgi:antitoxin (DNA-binding transcriptional repressor) of toxin-antitoxin stability system
MLLILLITICRSFPGRSPREFTHQYQSVLLLSTHTSLSRIAPADLAIYDIEMAISITKFKNSCLAEIRRVETTGRTVSITRRGRVVARLGPAFDDTRRVDARPWQQLRALGGKLLAEPGESVLHEEDFEALR